MTDFCASVIELETDKRLARHGLTLTLDRDTSSGSDDLVAALSVNNDAITQNKIIAADGSANSVDTATNEFIDSFINKIDNSGNNAVKLTIDVKKGIIGTDIDALTYIGSCIYDEYGFKPAFGTLKVDKSFGMNRHEANILLSSIPYFSELKTEKEWNLFITMQNNVGELLESGYFAIPEKEQVLDLLNTNSEYSRWLPVMQSALMMTFFEHIEGADLIHVTPSITMHQVSKMTN